MILVPLFDLKFLTRTRGRCCRNFKSAALAPRPRPRFRADVLKFGLPTGLGSIIEQQFVMRTL